MKLLAFRFLLIFLFVAQFSLLGCASVGKFWKGLISGESETEPTVKSRPVGTTFSEQNNLVPNNYRKYRRTTKKNFEDSAHLESKSGSLWVMEGQGAYLFSQNIVRMIGDPVAVKIDGDPAEQLASKVKVISKLQSILEDRRRRALGRAPTGEDKKEEVPEKPAGTPPGNTTGGNSAGGAPQNVNTANPEESNFSVKSVPTRIVERTVDGNYRVRGTQPFMIGPREYKVIVTGIVRAEDFNEEGLAASQLLDASYDIVSSKGSEI